MHSKRIQIKPILNIILIISTLTANFSKINKHYLYFEPTLPFISNVLLESGIVFVWMSLILIFSNVNFTKTRFLKDEIGWAFAIQDAQAF